MALLIVVLPLPYSSQGDSTLYLLELNESAVYKMYQDRAVKVTKNKQKNNTKEVVIL